METNLNSDLGEKSFHYDGKNDRALMKKINTANIAILCQGRNVHCMYGSSLPQSAGQKSGKEYKVVLPPGA